MFLNVLILTPSVRHDCFGHEKLTDYISTDCRTSEITALWLRSVGSKHLQHFPNTQYLTKLIWHLWIASLHTEMWEPLRRCVPISKYIASNLDCVLRILEFCESRLKIKWLQALVLSYYKLLLFKLHIYVCVKYIYLVLKYVLRKPMETLLLFSQQKSGLKASILVRSLTRKPIRDIRIPIGIVWRITKVAFG